MHPQPVFSNCDVVAVDGDGRCVGREAFRVADSRMGADTSVSGTLFCHGICLPSDTKMDDGDLARICEVIKSLWR